MNKYKLTIGIFIIISIFFLYHANNNVNLNFLHISMKILIKYQLHLLITNIDNSNPTNQDLLSLLHPSNNLPELVNYDLIPNRLFQIYMYYKNPIPQYIFNGIRKYAINYDYILFNENDAKQFLTQYFDKRIIQRFNDLKVGAHKADLLRYCYLYIYGGVYLDIKTILIKPLDEIFSNKTYFYTCKSIYKNTIYNAIIASKPRNLIFLQLINYIINIPLYIINFPFRLYYLTFCQDLYTKIQNDLVNKKEDIKIGLNMGESQNYYLFSEKVFFKQNNECNTLNKDGICVLIYNNDNKIFIGRDPQFPW